MEKRDLDNQVALTIRIFNVKILPKDEELYFDVFQKIFDKEIAINTRSDKYMEIHSLSVLEDRSAIAGELIYYTRLNNDDWYNKRTKNVETVQVNPDLNPNAKIGEFYFIPSAHRFCFVLRSGGISPSQVKVFIDRALRGIYPDKEVVVEEETSQDFMEKIMQAKSIQKIHVSITYTNDDLTSDFAALWDNDLKESNVGKMDIEAKASDKKGIDLSENKLIKGALELSASNGYAEVVVKKGKEREEYKTTEYPRTELIRTTIGQKVVAVRDRILSIFRETNGK